MDSHTRRGFLERLSALTVGGVSAAFSSAVANPDSEPHILFPTHSRERISIASYPFRAYIVSPDNRDRDTSLAGINLLEFPAHVVARFGIHNIEPHSRHFTSLQTDYLDSFHQILQSVKVARCKHCCQRSQQLLRCRCFRPREGIRLRKEMGGCRRSHRIDWHTHTHCNCKELASESGACWREPALPGRLRRKQKCCRHARE